MAVSGGLVLVSKRCPWDRLVGTEILVRDKTRDVVYAVRQELSTRQIELFLVGGRIPWLHERRAGENDDRDRAGKLGRLLRSPCSHRQHRNLITSAPGCGAAGEER